MTLRERLADVARFAVRPTLVAQKLAWGREAAVALLVLVALDLAIGLSSEVGLGLLGTAGSGGVLPAPAKSDISPTIDLINALVFAPVLEELLFRGWMTGRTAGLRFAAWGMAALVVLLVSLELPDELARHVAKGAAVGVLIALYQWSRSRDHDTAVPSWFIRHFHWLVWGSTLLFGAIHFGNFESLTHPLGILVVLPQTIGGLLLAYTRTRLGLGAAMAHHAAFNAVWMLFDHILG